MILRTIFLFLLLIFNFSIYSKSNKLTIASTTSINDTGLLDYINKEFAKEFNIEVHVLSLGTGQAIITAQNGNADIIIVHHKQSENKFINEGYGLKKYNLMYNDFILIGPKEDKNEYQNIKEVLTKIKKDKKVFISRSDSSGTHFLENSLWESLNLYPLNFDNWYKKIGQNMGAAINMANEMKAYTITDRGTWIAFNNKKNLKIIFENDPKFINQYSIIPVNPSIIPKLNYEFAKKYISWILSEKGGSLINNFKKYNQQLFIHNYY